MFYTLYENDWINRSYNGFLAVLALVSISRFLQFYVQANCVSMFLIISIPLAIKTTTIGTKYKSVMHLYKHYLEYDNKVESQIIINSVVGNQKIDPLKIKFEEALAAANFLNNEIDKQ
jgi:hypothetical protein